MSGDIHTTFFTDFLTFYAKFESNLPCGKPQFQLLVLGRDCSDFFENFSQNIHIGKIESARRFAQALLIAESFAEKFKNANTACGTYWTMLSHPLGCKTLLVIMEYVVRPETMNPRF